MSEMIKSLIIKAKSGDEQALKALVIQFQKPLYRFCFFLSKNETQAEELCQETFFRCFKHLKQVDPDQSLLSFLYKIAQNNYRDILRKKSKMNIDEEHDLEKLMCRNPEKFELKQIVQMALESLDESDRLVLLMIDMEDRSYDEVAVLLEISEGSLAMRLSRARQKFRESIERFKVEITGIIKIPKKGDVA